MKMSAEILEEIKNSIEELSKGISIHWDRCNEYISEHHAYFQVFGWIQRPDNKRDFVDLWVWNINKTKDELFFVFSTSSAKYSRKLSENWGCEHTDCQKWEEFSKSTNSSEYCENCKMLIRPYSMKTLWGNFCSKECLEKFLKKDYGGQDN